MSGASGAAFSHMTHNFDSVKKLTFTSCVGAVASAQRFHPDGEDSVCGGDCKPRLPHCLQRANTDAEFDYVSWYSACHCYKHWHGGRSTHIRAETLPTAPPCAE